MVDRFLAGGPKGVVEFCAEKFGGLLGIRLQLYAVAIRKLHDEPSQFEERICLGA